MTRIGAGSMVRMALLAAALSTYLLSPDDVVWHLIKAAPNARLLEHLAFGTATVLLSAALFLKMQAGASGRELRSSRLSRTRNITANLAQAVGIGFLLPLPGFVLLIFGEFAVSLLFHSHTSFIAVSWREALVQHLGLCCACISMLVFSILLVDRVADVLFAITGLLSVAALTRRSA